MELSIAIPIWAFQKQDSSTKHSFSTPTETHFSTNAQALYTSKPVSGPEIRLIEVMPSDHLEDRVVASMIVVSLLDGGDEDHSISYA